MSRDVIVVGTSAGGLEALKTLVSQLPADLEAAVFIVWHMPSDLPSFMPQVLNRHSALPVSAACERETFEPGHIYIAVPDRHLVLEPGPEGEPGLDGAQLGQMRLTHGPKENLFRPSIDVLFRSAALACGSRVIGVVLTGMLDDGASGLYAIKQRGGVAVVQDPIDALFPDMPINAMKAVTVDHTVPIGEMASLLVRLVKEPLEPATEANRQGEESVAEQMDLEVRVALEDRMLEKGGANLGEPSMFACPECHGVLMQIKEGPLLRFRCHTGHAYSISALLSGITTSVEDSLWSALRAIEESEMLMSQLASRLRDAGQLEAAKMFDQKVEQVKQRAELVRQAVLSQEPPTALGTEESPSST